MLLGRRLCKGWRILRRRVCSCIGSLWRCVCRSIGRLGVPFRVCILCSCSMGVGSPRCAVHHRSRSLLIRRTRCQLLWHIAEKPLCQEQSIGKALGCPRVRVFPGRRLVARFWFRHVDCRSLNGSYACFLAASRSFHTLQWGAWSHISSGMPRGHSIFFSIRKLLR